MATIGGTNKITLYDSNGNEYAVDPYTNALVGIDWAHYKIHAVDTFKAQHNNDAIPAVGSGGELVIVFFVPDQEKRPHVTWEFVHEGNMTMTLYEGVTFNDTAGSDALIINANRGSSNTSVLQGKATGSLASGYVTVGENSADSIYTGGSAINIRRNYSSKNAVASGSGRAEELLATNTNYAFGLKNKETSAQGGQIRLGWYE